MSSAKSLLWSLFVVGLFCLGIWGSSSYVSGLYDSSAAIRVSVPSEEMLYLLVFLFWFVLFLIPSWDKDLDHLTGS